MDLSVVTTLLADRIGDVNSPVFHVQRREMDKLIGKAVLSLQ